MKLMTQVIILYLCIHHSVASGGNDGSQLFWTKSQPFFKLWSQLFWTNRSCFRWTFTSMRLKNVRIVTTCGGNHHAWRVWWRQGQFWPYLRAYPKKWDYRVDSSHSSDEQKTPGSWLMLWMLVKGNRSYAWWQKGLFWPLAENVERWDNQGSRVNSPELFLANAGRSPTVGNKSYLTAALHSGTNVGKGWPRMRWLSVLPSAG